MEMKPLKLRFERMARVFLPEGVPCSGKRNNFVRPRDMVGAGGRWQTGWKKRWSHSMKAPVARLGFLNLFSIENAELPKCFSAWKEMVRHGV